MNPQFLALFGPSLVYVAHRVQVTGIQFSSTDFPADSNLFVHQVLFSTSSLKQAKANLMN